MFPLGLLSRVSPQGDHSGKGLHSATPRWTETGHAVSSGVSAGLRAVGLRCSASQSQMAPWLPVLRAEAIWWALMVFLIFVPFISLRNPSQAWFCGNMGDGDRSHFFGACKGLGRCLQVARIVSLPHSNLEKSTSSRFVDEVPGAQSGQVTLPRPHSRGQIPNQVISVISGAGVPPSEF